MPDGRPVRLLHAFATFALGGPQARFIRLVDALGPRFHHVIVAMDNCFDAAASIRHLPNVELLPLDTKRGRDLDNVPLLWRTLGSVRPDRLVSYNWGAFEWTFANAFRRVPQLHVEEGFGPQETVRRLPRRSMARRVGVRCAPVTLVTVSRTMARIAREEWRVRPSRLVTVANGVDVAGYRPRALREGASRFAKDGGRVVGTVAALRPEKRLDRLIEAFAIARGTDPSLRLVIAGDGPSRPELEACCDRLKVRDAVEFTGFVADPRALYAEFDAFALTSDTEQMPMAVLEAMAAGLPVVSTDVGDVREMVATENTEFVVPSDPARLARALHESMATPERARSIGMANHRRAREAFAASRMNDAWSSLYAAGRLAA